MIKWIIGTGFSFTALDKCFAQTEDNVATDLYEALQQFFDMFPALRPLDFYVSGESYGEFSNPFNFSKLTILFSF